MGAVMWQNVRRFNREHLVGFCGVLNGEDGSLLLKCSLVSRILLLSKQGIFY